MRKAVSNPTQISYIITNTAFQASHPRETYAVEQCPLSTPDAEPVVLLSNVTK